MMGDMGWTDIHIYIYIYIKEVLCMLRYWNRVIIKDNAHFKKAYFYVGLQQRR